MLGERWKPGQGEEKILRRGQGTARDAREAEGTMNIEEAFRKLPPVRGPRLEAHWQECLVSDTTLRQTIERTLRLRLAERLSETFDSEQVLMLRFSCARDQRVVQPVREEACWCEPPGRIEAFWSFYEASAAPATLAPRDELKPLCPGENPG